MDVQQKLMRDPASKSWWSCEQGPRIPFTPGGGPTFTAEAATSTILYVVEGAGDFPVDMLRYDRAFCLTPIPHPDYPFYGKPWRVVLAGTNSRSSLVRWDSFGWRILQGLKVPPNLHQRPLRWRGSCHRCQVPCTAFAMSYFDTAYICSECDHEERNHPEYDLVQTTFRIALRQGHTGFAGHGLGDGQAGASTVPLKRGRR